jgi:hypothetical protein
MSYAWTSTRCRRLEFLLRSSIAGATWLLLSAGPSVAVSYVVGSDETLLGVADLVAEVEVLGTLPSSRPGVTDYHAVVLRRLSPGEVASTVVIRQLGSLVAGEVSLHLDGVPAFEEGERAIVFLMRAEDGTYTIHDWALGAFSRVETSAGPVAVRPVQDAKLYSLDLDETADGVRDYDRFAQWVEDSYAGRRRAADYFVEGSSGDLEAAFTLLRRSKVPVRWFEFDQGSSVAWRIRTAGSLGTSAQFRRALDIWNGDAQSRVAYRYVGTTGSRSAFRRSDRVNAIVFGDPQGNIPGRFTCGSPGIVAAGGPWTGASRARFKGVEFYRVLEADIVVNDGAECLLRQDRGLAQELFAHELGHTLGLGHSCGDDASGACNSQRKNEALMRATLHRDHRSGRLRNDDRAGVRYLYGGSGGGGGGGGGGGALTAPSHLTARVDSRTAIRLDWRDNSTGEKAFEFYARVDRGTWFKWTDLPANTTAARATGVTPGTRYSFQVRAKSGRQASAFSNIVTITMPR